MEAAADVEKLVEVMELEVVLEFKPAVKCRADLHLRSLHPTSPVAFKVQTSSPHRFYVNPPSGLLPPLSSATLQVILRPQRHPPPSFPRSPSDRFLIKTSLSPHSFFRPSSIATHEIKLKVAYVGPFLLLHAASQGDVVAVRALLRRQKGLLSRFTPNETAALIHSASALPDPSLLHHLLDSGLQVPTPTKAKEAVVASEAPRESTALHAAAASGACEELLGLVEELRGRELDARDGEGRTPLHVAAGKGYMRVVRMLVECGADKDARSNDGRTALYRAAANGDVEMVALLLEMGADAGLATMRGRTPLLVAREKGHQEVVEILEHGEMILTAARRGDLKRLECLLKKNLRIQCHDQYGVTALHVAAIKGHREVVSLLIEFGMDMECQEVEGHTPLHLAVESGCLETVEVLMDMGANINARSKRGATPLYMASSMGYEAISQLLISRGASSSSCLASSSSSSASCQDRHPQLDIL